MKIIPIYISFIAILSASTVNSRNKPFTQSDRASLPQTVTLYPPRDRATGEYNETRACFNFKLGKNRQPRSYDWDLGYGFLSIRNEDWFRVSTMTDVRSVMKELGKFAWPDSFKIPMLEPLPELKEGEHRSVTIDSSADNHKAWANSTNIFAKVEVGHMYVEHVKDRESDFYVLFFVEAMKQGEYCRISWKRIATPPQ